MPLLVSPDVAIGGKRLAHAATYPRQKHLAVLWCLEVLPCHGRKLLDNLRRLEQILEGLFEAHVRQVGVRVARDEVHVVDLHALACAAPSRSLP